MSLSQTKGSADDVSLVGDPPVALAISRDRPLRLLYLLPAEAFGGAERQGVAHVRGLLELGFDVTALVGPGLPILEALRDAGVDQYIYVRDFPQAGRSRAGWAGTVGDWVEWAKAARRCIRTLLRIAQDGRFDAVFATRSISWPLAAMIAARQGIPYVVRAGGRPSNPLARPMLLFLRLVLPPPALLVANCESVRASLAKWFDCPSRILRNGIDLSRYSPRPMNDSRACLGLPQGRPIVGMAARPAPEKGFGFLAKVVRYTRERVPNVLFVVAGEHATRSYYERMMCNRGLSDSVRFLGHVSDIGPFYGSCDVVVLTSPLVSIEGSPNALLEAMAMARPIVATRVGGVPELVRDLVDGFLDEPNDPSGFAEHVVQLIDDPALRRRMGQSGHARAAESFDLVSVVRELAAVVRACAPTSPVAQVAPGLAAPNRGALP